MKKLERFHQIERIFGRDHLQEYYACYDYKQLCIAADKFEARGMPWNLRTDTHTSSSDLDQAMHAPFIFMCNKEKAEEVWQQFGEGLVYIVFRCMPLCYLNGVAIRIDDETVFIEYNEVDGEVPQRRMYDKPDNLSHLIVGQFRRSVLIPERWHGPVLLPSDEINMRLRFDEVYDLLLSSGEKEMTFAIRHPDKKVIIW